MIARLLVSYRLTGSEQGGTVGIDIDGYDIMSADDVLDHIFNAIDNIFMYDVKNRIQLINVVELQPRRAVMRTQTTTTGYRCECLVCGKENGHGGLPCPDMKVT